MATIRVRQLLDPTPEQLDSVAHTLYEAFKDETSALVANEGNADMIRPYQRAGASIAALAGELWIAGYGDDDYAGVAAWIAPGRELMDRCAASAYLHAAQTTVPVYSPAHGSAGMDAVLASFSPEHRKWYQEYLIPRSRAQLEEAVGEGYAKASWYLLILGTRPDHQGRGIGKMLFDVIAQKASAGRVNLCFCAVTEDNVSDPLYESWGCVRRGPKREFSNCWGSYINAVLIKAP
ncbi:hypothetical protein B0H21DRAFT_727879 [Amylocystis lapponica]|nr:hypothetical protein B0H21DRAFT_727879 [Amylocystis lapponica]